MVEQGGKELVVALLRDLWDVPTKRKKAIRSKVVTEGGVMAKVNVRLATKISNAMIDAAEHVLGKDQTPIEAVVAANATYVGIILGRYAPRATPKEIQRLSERLDETANAWIDEVRARETASN